MASRPENIMPDFCDRHKPFHYSTAINLLMTLGVDPDTISIMAVGKHENYKGEVRNQLPTPGTRLTARTDVRLEIGFSSAVDQMPYQFFYGLHGHHAGAGWELKARQLLAPFDGAVIRHEAIMRYMALRYNFSVIDDEFNRRYLDLFDFDVESETGDRDTTLWAALMPGFNEWSGNAKIVESILSRIFGYQFRLVENIQSTFEIPEDMKYYLGTKTGRLGHETVLGRSFTEFDSSFGVQILDVEQEDVAKFLPGCPLRKRLDAVLRLALPQDMEYRISFITTGRGTKIGDEKTGAYLGYATRL